MSGRGRAALARDDIELNVVTDAPLRYLFGGTVLGWSLPDAGGWRRAESLMY
ncbi:hypothetical protein [Kribbella sp. VKM Ac-2571]|uniref:hypothetical protein n=1 Tax=Kribbella sp. VKM Ac-2571 TaxID=2512222 RepID=UPI0014151749|nr:hypothetical protein [Kribbella sp. VKM Ac-2571]